MIPRDPGSEVRNRKREGEIGQAFEPPVTGAGQAREGRPGYRSERGGSARVLEVTPLGLSLIHI